MYGLGAGSGQFPQPLVSYNGLALVGQGIPPIVGTANLTAQGFAVFNSATPVTLVASGAGNAGTYRASLYLVISTTFVTNTTVNISLGYTDDQQAQAPIAISTSTLTAGTSIQTTFTLRSTGGTAITYKPGVTGSAATAGAAAFSVVLERLI
jgi:hypothetical protein